MNKNNAKPEAATSMALGDRLHTYSDDERDDEHTGNTLRVIVKMVGATAEDLDLVVSQGTSVIGLKRRIAVDTISSPDFVPPKRQRLIYLGRMLTNDNDNLVDNVGMNVNAPNYVHLAPIPRSALEHSRAQQQRNANTAATESQESDNDEEEEEAESSLLLQALAFRRRRSREMRRAQASPYASTRRRQSPETARRRPIQSSVSLFPPRGSQTSSSIPRPAASVSVQPLLCQEPVFITAPPSIGLLVPVSTHNPAMSALSPGASVSPFAMSVATSLPLGMTPQEAAALYEHHSRQRTNELIPLTQVLPSELYRLLAYPPTDTRTSSSSQLLEAQYQAHAENTALLLEQVAQQSLELANSLRNQVAFSRAQQQSSTMFDVIASSGMTSNPFVMYPPNFFG